MSDGRSWLEIQIANLQRDRAPVEPDTQQDWFYYLISIPEYFHFRAYLKGEGEHFDMLFELKFNAYKEQRPEDFVSLWNLCRDLYYGMGWAVGDNPPSWQEAFETYRLMRERHNALRQAWRASWPEGTSEMRENVENPATDTETLEVHDGSDASGSSMIGPGVVDADMVMQS